MLYEWKTLNCTDVAFFAAEIEKYWQDKKNLTFTSKHAKLNQKQSSSANSGGLAKGVDTRSRGGAGGAGSALSILKGDEIVKKRKENLRIHGSSNKIATDGIVADNKVGVREGRLRRLLI